MKKLLVGAAVAAALTLATATDAAGFQFIGGGFKAGDLQAAVYGSPDRKDSAGIGFYSKTPRLMRGTEYSTRRAQVDGRRIRAYLGSKDRPTSQGSIRLRLRVRRSAVTRNPCFRLTEQRGPLVGRVRFFGEDDYVTVDETRIRGYRFAIRIRKRCKGGPAPASSPARARPVTLTACTENDAVFGAQRFGETTQLGAYGPSTRKGAMPSVSYVSAAVGPQAFDYSDDLSSATVAPPAPFDGSATYSAADAELTGNLTWRALNGRRVAATPASASMERRDEVRCPRGLGGSGGFFPLAGMKQSTGPGPVASEALRTLGRAPGLPPLG